MSPLPDKNEKESAMKTPLSDFMLLDTYMRVLEKWMRERLRRRLHA